MELKDKGTVTIEKGNKKQIKCHRFMYNPIHRELMVHEDIDNKNHASVSDCITGYRLFVLPQKISAIKPSDITERLTQYISHYTKEEVIKEFKRVENLQQTKSKKA